MSSNIRINYYGGLFQGSGYGQAASDYSLALILNKADLNLRPLLAADPNWVRNAGRYESLMDIANREECKDPAWPTHVIAHSIPIGCQIFVTDELTPAPGVKKIAITTWETELLPTGAAQNLNELFDQVWLPTQYCKDAFLKSGAIREEKLRLVPHTFDPVWWFRYKETMQAPGPYVFYSILTWCERKNAIGTLKAYLTEFTNEDNVVLKIKTPHYDIAEINEMVQGMKMEDMPLPPVELICDPYSEDEMYDLHTQSHCYVSTARAEGWGLGCSEACLVGNPVIVPKYSGFMEFLPHYDNVRYLDYFLTPCYTPKSQHPNMTIDIGGGLQAKAVTRNAHTDVRGDQEWAEPNLHQLKQYMRQAYEERWGKSFKSRQIFAERYGYKTVGKKMVQLLKDM